MNVNWISFAKRKIFIAFMFLGIAALANQVMAFNNPIETKNLIQTDLSITWSPLLEQKDISIFYHEIKDVPCKGFQLKIVNHTNEKKEISFGVAGKLEDACRELYSNYGNFQIRKISLGPNETLIGSEKNAALLIPNSNNNIAIEELIQNLTIQNTEK